MAIGRFRAANRDYWDGEVDLNLESWDVDAFRRDPARLTRIVAADREALGDVQGRSLIHLQCHFGLDTLAWSRLGAEATGVDFSPRAIATVSGRRCISWCRTGTAGGACRIDRSASR